MKIKTRKVGRHYKLTEVAEFFDFNRERLLLQLACLAEDQTIHAHDIQKIKGEKNYRLSFFAVSILIFENDYSPETLERLADFCRDDGDIIYNPNWHSALLFAKKKFLAEKKISRLKEKKEQIKEENALLDYLVQFAPSPRIAVN